MAGESKAMVFMSMQKMVLQYLCELFTRNSKSFSYVLRNTETDVKLPKKKYFIGQRCFSYRGAKMWNDLPTKTKQASSLEIFKKLI